jgi:aminoglycoside phosphotransferase (APT) family kinase protein
MSQGTPVQELRQRLEGFLIRQTGKNVRIESAAPLAGGASRDMWVIEANIEGNHEKLVLRRDTPTTMHEQALSRAQEFVVMQAAFERGVRVARPRWLCEDVSVLGGAFFLMDYIEGITIGRKVVQMPELAHAREVLPAACPDPQLRAVRFPPSSIRRSQPGEGRDQFLLFRARQPRRVESCI